MFFLVAQVYAHTSVTIAPRRAMWPPHYSSPDQMCGCGHCHWCGCAMDVAAGVHALSPAPAWSCVASRGMKVMTRKALATSRWSALYRWPMTRADEPPSQIWRCGASAAGWSCVCYIGGVVAWAYVVLEWVPVGLVRRCWSGGFSRRHGFRCFLVGCDYFYYVTQVLSWWYFAPLSVIDFILTCFARGFSRQLLLYRFDHSDLFMKRDKSLFWEKILEIFGSMFFFSKQCIYCYCNS